MLCRPALFTFLQIGDQGLAVPDSNSGDWRLTCAHGDAAGQGGMAATRDKGNVDD